jgi:RHS repeat-associated protein
LYDQRGKVNFTTLPYFSPGSNFTMLTTTYLGALTAYDTIGRPFAVTNGVEIAYDSQGNYLSSTITGGDAGSPLGAAMTAYKDGSNPWAVVVTDPESKVRKSYHDAYGRTIQIAEVTSGGNINTFYKYDLVGNLTNVTDHVGNITRMQYDNLGRKTSMTEPNMGTWTYVYDGTSRLTQQVDSKSQKIEFIYGGDALGRMTAKKIYNASGTAVATNSYAYDAGETGFTVFKGQLFKVTDREGWTKFSYDVRGRIVLASRYLIVNNTSYTTATTYDDADRPRVITYPVSGDPKIEYVYTNGGVLSLVRSLAGTGTQEAFYTNPVINAMGQLASVSYGNPGTRQRRITNEFYSISKRLKRASVTNPDGGYHQRLGYFYTTNSNIKAIADEAQTSGSSSASLTNAVYDDLHRLTQATWTATGTKSFSYDVLGNIHTNTDFGPGLYSYSANKPHAVSSANGMTYQYDACGNMTVRGFQTLTYNEENRLTQVYAGPGAPTVTFGYADDGSRLWRNSTVSGLTVWIGGLLELRSGKTLCHVFAGGQRVASFEPTGGVFGIIPRTPAVWTFEKTLERAMSWPFAEGRAPFTVIIVTLLGVLAASILGRVRMPRTVSRLLSGQLLRDAFGLPSSSFAACDSSSVIRHSPTPPLWQQALSVILITALVFTTTNTNVYAQSYNPVFYYYHTDHLSSSNVLTDRNGYEVQRHEYSAFGKQRTGNGFAFPLTHRYTGQPFDDETGLYFYQSRYYDPELGRFVQADTIVPSAANPQTLNRYSYVKNNPLNYVDPSGHGAFGAFLVGMLVAAAVGAGVGAAVAAATGGDIGMGALTGAISGSFVYAGGVFGGAAAGAINAEITGGDPALGALLGAVTTAVSALVGYYSDTYILSGISDAWVRDFTRVAIHIASGAVVGGTVAAISGGDFWEGAAVGAAIGAVSGLGEIIGRGNDAVADSSDLEGLGRSDSLTVDVNITKWGFTFRGKVTIKGEFYYSEDYSTVAGALPFEAEAFGAKLQSGTVLGSTSTATGVRLWTTKPIIVSGPFGLKFSVSSVTRYSDGSLSHNLRPTGVAGALFRQPLTTAGGIKASSMLQPYLSSPGFMSFTVIWSISAAVEVRPYVKRRNPS